jgi:hypothetical protein
MTKEAKKANLKALNEDINQVYEDLLNARTKGVHRTSNERYHAWIENHSQHILPDRATDTNGIGYDIACHPLEYFQGMMYMTRFIENDASTKDENVKLLNIFPMSTSLTPRHFVMDSTALINIVDDESTILSKRPGHGLQERKELLWAKHFKTNHHKVFRDQQARNGFAFDHMIRTDGVSASLVFARKSLLGKPGRKSNKKKVEKPGTPYLADLDEAEKVSLRGKTAVAFDPNLRDLVFGVDTSVKERQNQWRYTMDTRRKEMNLKINRTILERRKTTTTVEGRSINEWEASGLPFTKKAMTFEKFMGLS